MVTRTLPRERPQWLLIDARSYLQINFLLSEDECCAQSFISCLGDRSTLKGDMSDWKLLAEQSKVSDQALWPRYKLHGIGRKSMDWPVFIDEEWDKLASRLLESSCRWPSWCNLLILSGNSWNCFRRVPTIDEICFQEQPNISRYLYFLEQPDIPWVMNGNWNICAAGVLAVTLSVLPFAVGTTPKFEAAYPGICLQAAVLDGSI